MDRKKKLDTEFEKVVTVAEGTVAQATAILAEDQKQEEKNRLRELDILHGAAHRGSISTYVSLLAKFLVEKLRENDWQGFGFQVAPTEVGIVLELTAPDGRLFRSAFKVTGEEIYDRNAVDVYCERSQNTVDQWVRMQQQHHEPSSRTTSS